MQAWLWVLIIVLALLVLYIVFTFNRFITLRNRAQNAWSQIDIQLKRRFDLIPNLIETVKGYTKHERETLKEVTEARTAYMKATGPAGKAKADNMLEGALKSIFALSERYPKLQANTNFMQLQEELTGTENKIAYSRQFYNDTIQTFNTKLESFPSNVVGRMFGFKEREFFEAAAAERENVKVKF
ncbi:MAG TPA: LemA family protein [Candidatus Nanoarchaeia archaeon]|nr:LemA family protein [Candidatus Nanoarchaeia archaeon]